MSTLITRPTTRAKPPGRPEPGRSLATSAALAGAGAAGIGLVLCMSVALTGWFLADGGAHGNTTDALGVGALAWLTGHGAHLTVGGSPIGVTPLAVTMLMALTAFRTGRWAARASADAPGASAPSPGASTLAVAVAAFTGAYLVVAGVTAVLAAGSSASPGIGRAVLGALVLSGLAGGSGLAAGTGLLLEGFETLPPWTREVVTGALTAVLRLVAAGAALVGIALLLSFNEAATVMSGLHLSLGDALSYTVVMALFAPNAALFGVSYLSGAGFAFGTGTTVSPTAVSLGVVPAFPMLAALPGDGPTPGWLVVLLAVPVLAAGAGVARTLRRHPPVGHDVAALRGAGAGFLAGVLTTVLVALAGGPLGTGRMADVGAPLGEVLVFATGLMSLGGLLGGVGQNWWRRRRGEPVGDDDRRRAKDRGGDEDGAEPTVEVLR